MSVNTEPEASADDDVELYSGKGGRRSPGSVINKDGEEEEIPYHDVEYMHDVPLRIIVQIGEAEMSVQKILALRKGAVCEFTKVVGEPVDIIVSGRLMARGEVVVVNERYGVRISEVTRPEEEVGNGP